MTAKFLRNKIWINPIQDGRGEETKSQVGGPTSFSLVTSTDVGTNHPKLSDF